MSNLTEPMTWLIRNEQDLVDVKNVLQQFSPTFTVTLSPTKATEEQTARMHCAIRCISRQVEWAGRKWNEEEWKRILVAGFFGQRVVPSPVGDSLVVIDVQTRNLSKSQKADFIDQLYAFGSEHGVEWDE